MIGGKVELEDVVELVVVLLVEVLEDVVGGAVVVLLELEDVVELLLVLVDVVEEVVGGAVVVLVEVVLVLVEVVVGAGTTGVSVLHSPLPGTPAKSVATFPPVASTSAVPLPSSSGR